ncbi:Pectin lyase-like superfamily protein isoform 1 [Hibiscus syriacus]|uniref:Pectin lyase-like superfamily protein isoform 1 n=1 Tax=Hibiscus syriacus TaxID=106335 RepID=A0A6A3CBG4_HIBSY|nr:Pectin lyase-like superfamily protein isoform 1 [Hibiscus syriacus]
MSCSSESTGLKPAMLSEKPSFTQICNLLSRSLKEKGSFRDLPLGMTCNGETNGTPQVPPTTMDLFPVDGKSGDVSGRTVGAPRNLRSMDLFPQRAGFSVPAPKDDAPKRVDCSTATNMNKFEPHIAQMTIFYANKSSSQTNSFNPTPFTSSGARSPIESSIGVPHTSKAGQPAQRPVPGVAADLPIARRASLHRFLEKRKDRITSKAPYQITSSATSPSESGDSKSWLGLAAQSP